MRQAFLTLTVLVLIFSCSSENPLQQAGEEFKSVQNGETKTKFDDLNDDVLYVILDRLELDALLKMADVGSRYSKIADDVFRRKYQNYQLVIEILGTTEVFHEDSNRITINNLPFALNLLKTFGHYFPAIKNVDNDLELADMTKIAHHLMKYCSKSLKKLELGQNHEILDQFTEPFDVVKELIVGDRTRDIDKLNLTKPLNELFPNLRALRLFTWSRVHDNLINCKWSRIEHFGMSATDFMVFNNDRLIKSVEEFILKNSRTLRSLEALFNNPTLFTFISHHLLHLESFAIANLRIETEVRFENLKEFRLTTNDIGESSPEKLSLPRLESLDLRCVRDISKWAQFLNRHTQIRRLYLSEIASCPDQINTFTANLTNLTDVKLKLYHDWALGSIVRFVENHQKMNRLQIRTFNLASIQLLAQRKFDLLQRFGDTWNIEELQIKNTKGLSLERKRIIGGA